MTVIHVQCRICKKVVKAHGTKYFRHCGIFQSIQDNKVSEISYGQRGNSVMGKMGNIGTPKPSSPPKPTSDVDQAETEKAKEIPKNDSKKAEPRETLEVEFGMKKPRRHEPEEEEEEDLEEEETEEEEDYQCGSCGATVKQGQARCSKCGKELDWARV
jgi:hypothetical protein